MRLPEHAQYKMYNHPQKPTKVRTNANDHNGSAAPSEALL